VSTVELETDDLPHPLSDGLVFGRDLARGFQLGFTGAHLSTMPQPTARKWVPVMDGADDFVEAWRARSIRERPGALATLANLDRGRMVYGRPRPYAPGLEKVRQGWLTYACSFSTVDDRFYGTTEKVAVAGVDPGSASALTFPLSLPFTGAAPTETRTWVDNAGSDSTWPVITFRAGGNPKLELLNDAGGVEWSLSVARVLGATDVYVVDTRPWVRDSTLNGTAAPGLLRGSRLDQVRIPTGTHELRLTAADPTGLAEVEVRWRDAFGSL
jgi:hypothetical protein